MIFRNSKRIGLLSLSLIALVASQSVAQDTTFRWKFAPGLKLRSEVSQRIEQGLPGSPQPVTQTFNLEQIWEVISVAPDKSARMRTTLERAVLSMNIPGAGPVELDTSNPQEQDSGLAGQVGKMFRPMIGQPCENDMAPNGKVSNVSIPDEAMSGFKNLPLGETMGSVLTDSIEKGSPVFPTEAIAPGHNWTQEHSIKTPVGDMTATTKFTYTGPKTVEGRKLHHFDMDLTVKFTGTNQLKAQIDIPEQSAKGSLLFDNDKGYLVSTTLDQSMKMLIKIGDQKGIESTTVQNTETTFKPVTE